MERLLLDFIILVGVISLIGFDIDISPFYGFDHGEVLIILIYLVVNSIFKIGLLRKHNLQFNTEQTSHRSDKILDSKIDEKKVMLSFSTGQLYIFTLQITVTLLMIYYCVDNYNQENNFWSRIFATIVLSSSTIGTIIYFSDIKLDQE